MKKVLFISAYLCASTVPAAGNKLSAIWLKDLLNDYDDVDIVTFKNNSVERYYDMDVLPAANSIKVFEIGLRDRLVSFIRYFWLPQGAAVRKYLSAKYINNLLSNNSYNDIFVDFTQAFDCIPDRSRKNITLRIHDIVSNLYETHSENGGMIRKLLGKYEGVKVISWEKNCLKLSGKIICLTNREQKIVFNLTGRYDAEVKSPTGLYELKCRQKSLVENGVIVFWGNMARFENIDAARNFAKNIFPRILEKIPHAKFVISGANPPADIIELASSNIEVTGFVQSPDIIFSRAHIGVVPLNLGAGIKIKTLEMLNSGIPVVATTIGAEGVAGYGELLQIANGVVDFSDKCINLMSKS